MRLEDVPWESFNFGDWKFWPMSNGNSIFHSNRFGYNLYLGWDGSHKIKDVVDEWINADPIVAQAVLFTLLPAEYPPTKETTTCTTDCEEP